MVLQAAANREDVLYRTDPVESLLFGLSQPSNSRSRSSGGGFIANKKEGARLDPGATTDDEAAIGGVSFQNIDEGIRITQIAFSLATNTPTGIDCEVGSFLFRDPAGSSPKAVYDAKNEVFNVEGTTTPAPSMNSFAGAVLTLIEDQQANETTFYLYAPADGINTEERINATADPTGGIARVQSNGTSEKLEVLFSKRYLIGGENR